MSKRNTTRTAPKTAVSTPESDGLTGWRVLIWAVFFVNSLVILPGCLDESLVPRFFFTAAALLVGMIWLRRDLAERGDLRLRGFDLLFLVWLAINWASVAWAFNWSEAVFFSQKVFLAFMVFWLFRQAMHRDGVMVRRVLGLAVPMLTFVVAGVILVQLLKALQTVGLGNEALYEYMKGLYGNKGLASNFLFYLLIFNLLVRQHIRWQWMFWVGSAVLVGLILLLQTRTVYLALAAAMVFYFAARGFAEADFRPVFLKKILPAAVVAVVAAAAVLAMKGRGTSLAERLNPMTYLESASANERRFVWYKTDILNRDRPLLGVGNGSWKIFFPSKSIEGAYRLQEKGVIFTRAHNDYLEIRAEMGLVGVSIFILLFAAAAAAIFWGLKNLENVEHRRELAALGAGIVGYSIIQFFDFPRERMEQQVMLAICLGWAAFLAKSFWEKLPGISTAGIFQIGWWAKIAGLVFCLVIGWFRIEGERHNLKALEAQAKNQNDRLITEAQAAENPFYQLSDVVLPMAWFAGVGYFQKGETERAVENFARAFAQNPYSFQVINNYAASLVKAKRYADAIPLFEKTLEINPKYDEGKFNLSYTYFQMGEFQKSYDFAARVDTIVGAKTADELEKNRVLNQRRREFMSKAGERLGKGD